MNGNLSYIEAFSSTVGGISQSQLSIRLRKTENEITVEVATYLKITFFLTVEGFNHSLNGAIVMPKETKNAQTQWASGFQREMVKKSFKQLTQLLATIA